MHLLIKQYNNIKVTKNNSKLSTNFTPNQTKLKQKKRLCTNDAPALAGDQTPSDGANFGYTLLQIKANNNLSYKNATNEQRRFIQLPGV